MAIVSAVVIIVILAALVLSCISYIRNKPEITLDDVRIALSSVTAIVHAAKISPVTLELALKHLEAARTFYDEAAVRLRNKERSAAQSALISALDELRSARLTVQQNTDEDQDD